MNSLFQGRVNPSHGETPAMKRLEMLPIQNARPRVALSALAAAMAMPALSGCASLQDRFEARAREELARSPATSQALLDEADLAHLPVAVRRYLIRSGAVGKPKVHNFRAEFEAVMYRKPGAQPMPSPAVQYSFLESPTRLFFMRSRMMGLPVRVLHAYSGAAASMQVRVAGVFDAVKIAGGELDPAETVTMLNDLCLLAPAALVGPSFSWEAVDDRSAKVTFQNGPHRISAQLLFDDEGDLVNFISDDRGALQDDGTLKRFRWSTPVGEYRDYGGRRLASHGAAIWHYPEGDFTYGTFMLRSIEYNVSNYRLD